MPAADRTDEAAVTPAPPVRPRHYEPEAALVRRTRADVSDEFMTARAYVEPFTEALLGPRPAQPRLVGSCTGTIERILFTIPAYAVGADPLAGVYRDTLRQLRRGIEVVALTHESVAPAVQGWLDEAGHGAKATVIVAPDHLRFSIWAEDGYVVVTEADGATYFLEPFSFPRYADSLVADFVANATDLRKTQAPLYFQGGNVLVGDDFFLIGADYPANSLRYIPSVIAPSPGESGSQLVRRLYGEYLDTGRRLVYVGSTVPVPQQQARTFELDGETWTEHIYLGNRPGTAQPLFHIDMFLTLAGPGSQGTFRVLVGDPRLAARVLGEPLRPHAMAEVFDDIARTLGRAGFEVLRNPLPLVYVDDARQRERFWYFATSNNALVEIPSAGPPAVYLPTYGHGAWASLSATDEANREIWEGLGFATHLLGDFHPFAENLGAVHCIKKYLRRSG